MADYTWKSILNQLVVKHEHLTQEQSEWYVDELMDGNADAAAVGAVLATQQQLGLTADEVAGAAHAMVEHALPLPLSGETTDLVGTGGHCSCRGSQDRQARQPRRIQQVRCCRLPRSARTSA